MTGAAGSPRALDAVTLDDVRAARAHVERVAVRTPVFNSRGLSQDAGSRVVFKAENLQRTGSFKVRGVANKLAILGSDAAAGIVVASAGNHAQAAAFVAAQLGISCEVFMPATASIAKSEATIAYGAEVHLGGDGIDECLELARARVLETGKVLVHPFDDLAVIAGQGSLGLELVEDISDLALVVVPLGGGGLAAGVALAVKSLKPSVRVVAVQAASVAPFPASIAQGRTVEVTADPTLADGISVRRPGELTLPLVAKFVDDIVTVGEDEIADAMVLLLERAKLLVEGAGAVGAAAVASRRVKMSTGGGTTAVVLSGGNVDTGLLLDAIRRHETRCGRRLVLFARMSDRPGQLARLLTRLGASGANLLEVDHLREGFDLHVRENGVQLVLETRNPAHAASVICDARAEGFDVDRVGHAFAAEDEP
ncbi:MAG: pyridoxal-phosphate dependent enzyme [Acidimicrobiales bacterium]